MLENNPLFKTNCYIDGKWAGADKTFSVFNPADQSELAKIPDMGASETKQAINAANQAWDAWRQKSAEERSDILSVWYNLQIKHIDDIAEIMTAEQGKNLNEAKGEIQYGANFIKWYAEEAKRAYGEIIPAKSADARSLVIKQPVGVVGAITPWNFPYAMITRKAAPALAAGCTIICKPAEDTPLTALAIAYLAEQAGIPKGVFNVITASKGEAIGNELTSNPLVRKISFTGSTRTGKILMKNCADTVKKLSLELGGNASFIVFDDADLDQAVSGLMGRKFGNAGQICVAPNRIFVQEKIYEEFAEKLSYAVKQLKLGQGFEEGVQLGPLINDNAIEKVQKHVASAVASGAKVMTGGQISSLGKLFYEPTVLRDATTDMIFSQEETFGPVAPLIKFKTEADAVRLANETEFGLANYFYTQNIGRLWRVSEALESGIVGANTSNTSGYQTPFGGMKQSGMGREGGHYGLEEFLEIKHIQIGGLE